MENPSADFSLGGVFNDLPKGELSAKILAYRSIERLTGGKLCLIKTKGSVMAAFPGKGDFPLTLVHFNL